MKQALIYTLKVALSILILCLPITFAIMMAYLRLLPLIFSNYSVNVHLDIKEVAVFIGLTCCVLLFNMGKIKGITPVSYNKQCIRKNSLTTSIAAFLVYLLIFGKLMVLSIDGFLITYGPSFLIMLICMRLFPLRNEDEQV